MIKKSGQTNSPRRRSDDNPNNVKSQTEKSTHSTLMVVTPGQLPKSAPSRLATGVAAMGRRDAHTGASSRLKNTDQHDLGRSLHEPFGATPPRLKVNQKTARAISPFMTIEELRDMWRCSRRHVERVLRDKKIKKTKIGRRTLIDRAEALKYTKKQRGK